MLKIAITGSESTGKTTLATQLAKYYQTTFVAEFAREYLLEFTQSYQYEDVIAIAKGQIQQEKRVLATLQNQILIVDTELLVIKIWLEDVFGKCEAWILEALQTPAYDFYFLTAPDTLWEYDQLRENPHRREYFHKKYKDELSERHFPFLELYGSETNRLQTAITQIDRLLKR